MSFYASQEDTIDTYFCLIKAESLGTFLAPLLLFRIDCLGRRCSALITATSFGRLVLSGSGILDTKSLGTRG